jgi:Rod binding domain-containing protein
MNSIPLAVSLPPNLALSGDTVRGANAARDFEAYLIGTLLQGVEKAFAAMPGQDAMAGSDDYNYLATRALAQGIADRGGFGIASMVRQHLSLHEGKGEPVSKDEPPSLKFQQVMPIE